MIKEIKFLINEVLIRKKACNGFVVVTHYINVSYDGQL